MIITNHAYKRAKERLGWKKKTLDRMVPIIENKHIPVKEFKGKIRRYLDKIGISSKMSCMVYGEAIFLFQGDRLVTIYQTPNKLKNGMNNKKENDCKGSK